NEQRKVRKAPVKLEPRRPVETPRARPSLALPDPAAPPAAPPAPLAPPVLAPALSLQRVPATASTVAKEEIVVARAVSASLPASQRAGQAAPTASVLARRR